MGGCYRDSASLHPCLYYNVPTGLCLDYEVVTLLRSSIRNKTFFYRGYATLHPCLYSDVPMGLCLSCFTRHFGLRLGRVQVNFLFHKELFLAMAEPKQA